MDIKINPVFSIGEIVYLKTDDSQTKRMITGYTIRLKYILYLVSSFGTEDTYYDFELTNQYDTLKDLLNDKEVN